MATVRKTITLSDTQDAWIKSRIASGDYTNDSEYIRALVRRDRERRDGIAALKAAITEGLESGVSDQSLDDLWQAAEDRHCATNA